MKTIRGVRRRELLATGGAVLALAPLAGWAHDGPRAPSPPTLWWAGDDLSPLRPAASLRGAVSTGADLRLTVDRRSGTGAPAGLALRHPTLPDLWHTVWADEGHPGGAPAGVTVRLSPDDRGIVHLMVTDRDAEHPLTLHRAVRGMGLRPGRWVVALPPPDGHRPRLGDRTAVAVAQDPTLDLLLLRIEATPPPPTNA